MTFLKILQLRDCSPLKYCVPSQDKQTGNMAPIPTTNMPNDTAFWEKLATEMFGGLNDILYAYTVLLSAG